MASTIRKTRAKLREFALGLPDTHEDLPWGERVVKVKKKVFVFLGRDMDTHFGFGVKLTASHQSALRSPHAEPMGYGLGKSGWVSAKFEAAANPSFELLKAWILESYCAVAPKTLAARVRGAAGGESKVEPKRAAKTQAPAKSARVRPRRESPKVARVSRAIGKGAPAKKRAKKA